MGNSSSTSSGRSHQEDSVDFGSLIPQGVYTGQRDWNQAVVSQLICARRLAPFYRPLEDYDESWDDDKILANRKELPPDSETNNLENRVEASAATSRSKRAVPAKEPSRSEAALYRGAVECPICFLYFPPNINHSRCCDQAICTECFVQIKRSEPTTTHIVSEPAACPYCVQDNFGVVYSPPPWRAGIGADSSLFPWADAPKGSPHESSTPYPTHKRRQKSYGHTSPEVVTTDQIRPDWEAKLAAVRAAVARRANRRIIMRQVGDQLIPVGVTSGRVHPISPEEAAQVEQATTENGSRRSRRRNQQGLDQFLGNMGMGGQELEELMMMEAMRLSLIDHEEHQRKEAEEEKKKNNGKQTANQPTDNAGPGPSTLETRSATSTNLPVSSPPVSASLSVTSSTPSTSPPSRQSGESRRSFVGIRHSRSRSRVRTPSPPPTNPIAAVQSLGSSENQSGWRLGRSSSKPAFSTLTAALSAASTVGAVLGNGSQSPASIEDDLLAASTTSVIGTDSSEQTPVASPPLPTITVDAEQNVQTKAQTTESHVQIGNENTQTTESRPEYGTSTSFASSIVSQGGQLYDNLPSSPDSVISQQPLLTPTTQFNTVPNSTISAPDDYFGNTEASNP